MRATTKLRRMLETGRGIVAPGVYDGLSARLAAQAGFEVAYASGGAIARSAGVPDLGLLTMSEVADTLQNIADVVEIPVIADADTGYGNALNTGRAVRAFERAGIAALHLEDQTFPKKCGHYDDKSLVSVSEMIEKLKAARDALHDQDLVLIARSDAIAVEGLEASIERGSAYIEAGADMVFIDAPTSLVEIAEIARRIPGWKLIDMFQGGKTPLLPAPYLHELGYQLVIIPSDLQRASIRAMQRALQCIARDGSTAAMSEDMASFTEREEVVGTAAYLKKAGAIAR